MNKNGFKNNILEERETRNQSNLFIGSLQWFFKW